MNSLTPNTELSESPKAHTEELGDSEENRASRHQARLVAAKAVAGLNHLRERKRAALVAAEPPSR
jgi:hypothetical protein